MHRICSHEGMRGDILLQKRTQGSIKAVLSMPHGAGKLSVWDFMWSESPAKQAKKTTIKWQPYTLKSKTPRLTRTLQSNPEAPLLQSWTRPLRNAPDSQPQPSCKSQNKNCAPEATGHPSSQPSTWRFMGSYNWGDKSPNMAYKYSYPTYNPTYNWAGFGA